MAKTLVTLDKTAEGRWNKSKAPSPGGCVMHSHVAEFEKLMKEKYVRENTRVGSLSPEEMIQRIQIDEDGTILLYITDKERWKEKQCQA